MFLNFFEESFGDEQLAALSILPTATAKLQALVQMMTEFSRSGGRLFNLFLEFWASSAHRDEAARLWVEALVRYKEVVAGIVREGVTAGEFRPADADSLAWVLPAAYDGLTAYLLLLPELEVEQIGRAFVETLLNGPAVGNGNGTAN